MPTIDATLGGANSNSYVTEAEADAYWSTQLYDTWTAATSDDKQRALIQATDRIDKEDFYGDRKDVTTPQRLKFPRTGLDKIDGIDINDVIPRQIKEATYELAKYLLTTDMNGIQTVTTQTKKKKKVSSLEIEYAIDSGQADVKTTADFPENVSLLLDDLVVGGGTTGGWFYVG